MPVQRFSSPRPGRAELAGFSASEFKTLLRRRGYQLPRDFYQQAATARRGSRRYRFRYWGTPSTGDSAFVVDVSCQDQQFDRWANSVEKTMTIAEWLADNNDTEHQ